MSLQFDKSETVSIVEEPPQDLPTKSSSTYEAAYQRFMKWCQENKISCYTEAVLLDYFTHLANVLNMKISSMWAQYSMIKRLLNIKERVDISRYLKLRAFLKKKNKNYIPKKSKAFTKEQFEKFLLDADDEKYLGMKIVLLIGVSGACSCEELVKMKTNYIEDLGNFLHIKIPDSKTNKIRSFTILEERFINIYRKYASLRPKNVLDSRFFLKYSNNKCIRSVMGIHKIGSIPREIASYLQLPDSKEYTGHCLRRTSATLLMHGGTSITCSRRDRTWRSSNVAKIYVEDSCTNGKDEDLEISQVNCKVEIDSDSCIVSNSPKENLIEFTSVNSTLSTDMTCSTFSSSKGVSFQGALVNNCIFKVDEADDEDANGYDLEFLKSEISESYQSVESDSLAISEGSKRLRRSGPSNECSDSFVQKLLANKSIESTQDMWHKFGSFVESSLRNMKHEKNRLKCKHEILQIIMRFEEEETL